ncbi:MAG: M48 family metalloprotease [Paracoccaceae bacterium]
MRLFRTALAVLLVAGVALSGCTPGTGAPSEGQSLRAERDFGRAVLADLQRDDRLIEDRALNRYVADIADRIEPARPRGAPRLRTVLVKDPGVNAFTTGGGYVFVTAGLIGAMENEAQFAFVLAHETAHIDRGHVTTGARQRQTASAAAMIGAALAVAAGVPGEVAELGAGLSAQAAVADFSRDQEADADAVAVGYVSQAGWSALEGGESFAVMRRLYGDSRGAAAFFASHPPSSDRQARIARRARALGATEGRVNARGWLRATGDLRRELLAFYRREGRAAEARQMQRNLRAGR